MLQIEILIQNCVKKRKSSITIQVYLLTTIYVPIHFTLLSKLIWQAPSIAWLILMLKKILKSHDFACFEVKLLFCSS